MQVEIDESAENFLKRRMSLFQAMLETNILVLLGGKKMHQLPRNSCETAGSSRYEHFTQATSFRDTSAIFMGKNPPAIG
jgi:hypothetical protein